MKWAGNCVPVFSGRYMFGFKTRMRQQAPVVKAEETAPETCIPGNVRWSRVGESSHASQRPTQR